MLYSKFRLYLFCFVLSVCIFCLLNSLWNTIEVKSTYFISKQEKSQPIKTEPENQIENKTEKPKEEKKEEVVEKPKWRIEIPSLSLMAEIQEGTTKEVMDEFVGHFEETSKTEGNVGLIAHNRRISSKLF